MERARILMLDGVVTMKPPPKICTRVNSDSIGPLLERLEAETSVMWSSLDSPANIEICLDCEENNCRNCYLSFWCDSKLSFGDKLNTEQLVTPNVFVRTVADRCPPKKRRVPTGNPGLVP